MRPGQELSCMKSNVTDADRSSSLTFDPATFEMRVSNADLKLDVTWLMLWDRCIVFVFTEHTVVQKGNKFGLDVRRRTIVYRRIVSFYCNVFLTSECSIMETFSYVLNDSVE